MIKIEKEYIVMIEMIEIFTGKTVDEDTCRSETVNIICKKRLLFCVSLSFQLNRILSDESSFLL